MDASPATEAAPSMYEVKGGMMGMRPVIMERYMRFPWLQVSGGAIGWNALGNLQW